jgi:hypothetical protein
VISLSNAAARVAASPMAERIVFVMDLDDELNSVSTK